MKRIIAGGIVAAVTCCLPIVVQARPQTQDQPTVTIARPRKAGDVVRMKVNATADVAGTEVTLERTVKTEVKEIKKTGEVVIVSSDLGGKVNAGGQEMEIPPTGPVTTTFDKLGRPVKYERSASDMSIMAPEVEQLIAVMQDYVLPDKPVKAGDAWENELPNPLFKDKKVQVKTTFVGMDKLEEAEVWKLKQTMAVVVDADGSKMSAELVFLVDPATGTPRTAEGAIKGVPTQYGPVDLRIKATLLKPEAPKTGETPK
jgi:hypothetical protein